MKKNCWIRILVIILAVLLLILVIALSVRIVAALKNAPGGGVIAVITVDGEVRERIDLTKVQESRDLVIETAYGKNTVHVEQGAISVTEADCPDRICVAMGRLTTDGGLPIICMPHRLMIEIEDGTLDG